ncbi:MAG: hypothetical protein P8Y70_04880, partial [Candidatus Lokiarchaeota archaeon]
AHELLDQETVDNFLPQLVPYHKLDPAQPVTMGAFALPELFAEVKMAHQVALNNSYGPICEIWQEWGELTGRYYKPVETYRTENAKTVILIMGSLAEVIVTNFNSNISSERDSYQMILNSIAELLGNNQIDISDFYLKFKSSWGEIDNSLYLTLKEPTNGNQYNSLILNIVDNEISLFSILPESSERKVLGYKYFNIEDNQNLKSMLNQSYLISDQKNISNTIKSFLS